MADLDVHGGACVKAFPFYKGLEKEQVACGRRSSAYAGNAIAARPRTAALLLVPTQKMMMTAIEAAAVATKKKMDMKIADDGLPQAPTHWILSTPVYRADCDPSCLLLHTDSDNRTCLLLAA
jgi:hypothetical protein